MVLRAIVGGMREALSRVDGVLMDWESRLMPDNSGMSQSEIRRLLMIKCKSGESYYPSDLAFEYGLDFDEVIKAVDYFRRMGMVKDGD